MGVKRGRSGTAGISLDAGEEDCLAAFRHGSRDLVIQACQGGQIVTSETPPHLEIQRRQMLDLED